MVAMVTLALELGVGVDERLAESPRQLAAERGLARAGQSDQKQIAPMQMHRGIVVETDGPDEPTRGRYFTAVTDSFTTRGVRKIRSSCFSLPRVVVLKRYPKNGMSPSSGTLSIELVIASS